MPEDTVQAAVNNGIEEAIRQQEGGFTLRWIAIVESTDNDGQRGVWTLASDDMRQWEALGLLEYGKQVSIQRLNSDEDDD